MIKIAITGSIASGKTTATKIISNKLGPLFNADLIVKELYKKKKFQKLVAKKLNFKFDLKFKINLKNKILYNKENLNKLEKTIHPRVRKEMIIFSKKNKKKKFLFYEIPLLIESKLNKYFDKIIFIKSDKKLRMRRYLLKGGNIKLFNLLDSKQIKDRIKMKLCDHIIVNNTSLSILKKKIKNIIKMYE